MPVQLQEPRFDTNSHGTYRPGNLSPNESRVVNAGVAHLRYILWQVVSKLVMGLLALGVTAEGARRVIPSFGIPIFKLMPLLAHVDHRIDIAHCFALALMFGTWWSWANLLESWLGIKPYSRATTIIVPLALTLIVVDTWLFYTATAQWKWGGSSISLASALATAGYIALFVIATYVGVELKHELRKEKS
jgi:hypothetical protein